MQMLTEVQLERDTERERDRQTDSQPARQPASQPARQTDRQTDRETERQRYCLGRFAGGRERGGEREGERERGRGREREREREGERERERARARARAREREREREDEDVCVCVCVEIDFAQHPTCKRVAESLLKAGQSKVTQSISLGLQRSFWPQKCITLHNAPFWNCKYPAEDPLHTTLRLLLRPWQTGCFLISLSWLCKENIENTF